MNKKTRLSIGGKVFIVNTKKLKREVKKCKTLTQLIFKLAQ